MTQETLVNIFWERVTSSPERPAILHKVDGRYRPVIWREQGRVTELSAGGLLSLNVLAGDKVAIVSHSKPQWTWADLSILSVGGVTVPIYPTLGGHELEYLIQHSDVIGAFVEDEHQLEKLMSCTNLPASFRFVVLFSGKIPPSRQNLKILKWEDLLENGEVYLPNHRDELLRRISSIKPDDLATIVYTSGTTGVPKGAMLLHSNIYSVCQSMSALIGFHADDLALSFLPLSHVFERIGGQFLSIYEGLIMAYAESIETVAQNMLEVRPTIMNGVPRFFEKVYQRVQFEVRKMPKAQQYLIRWALALGKRASQLQQNILKDTRTNGLNDIVSKFYKAELRVAERLVYSRIRRRLGGRLRFMSSGAAPLSPEVQSFFQTIGVPIIEGYGLTETSAPVCCNTLHGNERGTVGRPLPGVEVRLGEDGEIMVKGDNVFAGYYKDKIATQEAFENGWFKTGDIGEIDPAGYIKIKDRKKDIIITAGGKHVAPQYIENLFVSEHLISHVLVYGDRRKYITALITLSEEGLMSFARLNSITYSSVEELVHHPLVIREVEAIIARKNQLMAQYEQIKKFLILEREFTVQDNELTPTLKVKRKIITEKYRKSLDSLYDAEELEIEDARL